MDGMRDHEHGSQGCTTSPETRTRRDIIRQPRRSESCENIRWILAAVRKKLPTSKESSIGGRWKNSPRIRISPI